MKLQKNQIHKNVYLLNVPGSFKKLPEMMVEHFQTVAMIEYVFEDLLQRILFKKYVQQCISTSKGSSRSQECVEESRN